MQKDCLPPPPSELRVPDLGLPQQIAIWSLRRYSLDDSRCEALAPMFNRIFGLAGVEAALIAFAGLMSALERHGRRPLRIGPLSARQLSPDEICILRLLAALQGDDGDTASAVASWLVTTPGIEDLLLASGGFAQALAAQGHRLDDATPRLDSAAGLDQEATEAVAALAPGERLLLQGIRLWVDRFKRQECGLWALSRHFAAHGLSEATPSLHAILFNSSVATTRSLDVRCKRCPWLSPDEARMLHAVASFQAGEAGMAAVVLSSWLAPAAVRLTIEAVRGLADSLTAEHVQLPLRCWRFPELSGLRTACQPDMPNPEGRLH